MILNGDKFFISSLKIRAVITVKTGVYEPSDFRTYSLNLGILIPKYIRTYLAWQRKIGSYTKKHSYFIAKILDFCCLYLYIYIDNV